MLFHIISILFHPQNTRGVKHASPQGTGGALVASASSLNFVNVILHWLVPVPEARWKTKGALKAAIF